MIKLLQSVFRRETLAPVSALALGSAMSVLLVIGRVMWTENLGYAFLIWNLFLAWLPLLFAFSALDEHRRQTCRRLRLTAVAGAWLLFFPNAPYIFTDLIHLTSRLHGHFWVDMTLILLSAFTGLMVGFLSLYLMQSIVVQRFGQIVGWLFVASAAGLSSIGVYIGRFMRFNSWDVFLRPGRMYHRLDAWLDGPMLNPASGAFLILFAIFLFSAYVMLYALTHLPPASATSPALEAGSMMPGAQK